MSIRSSAGPAPACSKIVSGNQIRTKAGASFNYEGGPTSYTLTLRVRDNNNTGLCSPTRRSRSTSRTSTRRRAFQRRSPTICQRKRRLLGRPFLAALTQGPEVDYAFAASGMRCSLSATETSPAMGAPLRLIAPVNFERSRLSLIMSANPRPAAMSTSASSRGIPRSTIRAERVVRVHFDNVNEAPAAPTGDTDGASAVNENMVADELRTRPPSTRRGLPRASCLTGAHAAYSPSSATRSGPKANLTMRSRRHLTASVAASDGSLTGAFWTKTVTLGNVDEAPNVPPAVADQYVNENAGFSVGLSGSVDPEGARSATSSAWPAAAAIREGCSRSTTSPARRGPCA